MMTPKSAVFDCVASAGNSLLELSRTIATHLSGLRAAAVEMQQPLQHLLNSAQRAAPRPTFVAAAHGYSALVVHAAQYGLGGAVSGIARDLLKVQEALPWVYHYEPRAEAEDLSKSIAFAELIGPDGPMAAPACRVGFTIMAENTSYPLHAHPAVELYLIVSGRSRWRTASSDRMISPGEWVLHRANEPHAMCTFDEPLLALWGWSGEIDSPALYI